MRIRTALFLLSFVAAFPAWADSAATQPVASSAASTAPAPVAVTPVEAPTSEDQFLTEAQLVQAYRAGQFPLIVHEVFRIQSNAAAAAHAKLFDLLVLKAESQLQSRNVPAATESFNEAAKIAPDDDRKAVMLATAMLLRQQFEFKYLSRTTDDQGMPLVNPRKLTAKPVGIDLLDLSKRAIALHALCSDQLAKANQLLARAYASIPALEPLFKVIDDVSITERAAEGTQIETKKLQARTAELAGAIINGLIAADTRSANRFQREAAGMVPVPPNSGTFARNSNRYGNSNYPSDTQTRLRGLTDSEAAALQDMVTMTIQVPAETKKLVDRLHVDANFFDVIIANADALHKLAQGILDTTPVYTH